MFKSPFILLYLLYGVPPLGVFLLLVFLCDTCIYEQEEIHRNGIGSLQ